MSDPPARSRLLAPPRLRTVEGAEDERRATWLELLFALVFVVAVAQPSNALSEDRSLEGFLILCVAVGAAGVILLGVGVEHAVEDTTAAELLAADRWLVCGGAALVFGALAVVRLVSARTRRDARTCCVRASRRSPSSSRSPATASTRFPSSRCSRARS